ncbi:MAG: phenylalanine--tRNA ligase subunit beta [Parcubacteria group bacterium]|jgi:phenylalanyl-tRNA synthetase beta chain
MKYSYTWLKELSKTKKSPKQLADLLTMRSFEFEGLKTEGKETQMEFSILPNRGHDALSHIGMAREICALEGRKFTPTFNVGSALAVPRSDLGVNIEIKDKKLCLRYVGAVIKNIKISPSPKWMQTRLLVSGVKPINNIVDITNYVMLETGQPMHSFDLEKIKGEISNKSKTSNSKIKIIIRRAKKNEKIILLDDKEYMLSENDLVIADSEKVLALAGVMGGSDSAISNKTASIVLESANFNATSIRKTRTSQNIITESSHRFEREIDPNLAETAMARAIELTKEICGKNIEAASIMDIYPKKVKPWQVKLDTNYVNRLLGENIPIAKMKNILENLGLKSLRHSVSKWIFFEIPTHRIDLKTQEDLIEEIGRIYGYENIKEQAPCAEVKALPRNEKRDFENKLRDILIGFGFSEVMNYSFYGKEDIEKCGLRVEDHIEVANPLSSEQQYLRETFSPGILKNVNLNLKNFSDIKIFEIGREFGKKGNTPYEESVLAGGLVSNSAKENSILALKGELESILNKLGLRNIKFEAQDTDFGFWHPSRISRIIINGEKIGKIGEINPLISKKYGIKQRVAYFGLGTEELLRLLPKETLYHSISKFPIVERDLSMFIEKDTKYADIVANVKKTGGSLVKNIDLFDVFEKEGEKSLALRLKIGSDAKTLTSEEIDAVMEKIISSLEKELKVKVRK